jgi:hypothetical protein|tara:strand:+ start:325 stop:624 length:300 start_codon:yes stop_codon:yes gene_type:complete
MKKLSDLAGKPELTPMVIDNADIVEKYGEELEFYVYDKLPISTYTKLASLDSKDAGQLYAAVKDLILDDKGLPVVNEEKTLPMDIMNAAILKVTESLGK